MDLNIDHQEAGEVAWALLRLRCSKTRCPEMSKGIGEIAWPMDGGCKFFHVCNVCIDPLTEEANENNMKRLYQYARRQCRAYAKKNPEKLLDEMGYTGAICGG